ncbi:hypothetical protein CK203_019669 [Vitis vinifera]|uniref:Uncharacterized protein n=1 Tax=Vitis vinifera TaxID=29760 RepID=A0A438JQJ5_VITVI|nr:hypothetical protein CK203_019669 [Vitis vinifera]
MASLLHLRHPHSVFNLSSSSPTLLFLHSPHHIPLKPSHSTSITLKFLHFRPHTAPFALTDSDSPKSLSPTPKPRKPFSKNLLFGPVFLQDSFDLPSDYFAQLPRDLRLDLNDAAFDLSSGPVIDENKEDHIKAFKPYPGDRDQPTKLPLIWEVASFKFEVKSSAIATCPVVYFKGFNHWPLVLLHALLAFGLATYSQAQQLTHLSCYLHTCHLLLCCRDLLVLCHVSSTSQLTKCLALVVPAAPCLGFA